MSCLIMCGGVIVVIHLLVSAIYFRIISFGDHSTLWIRSWYCCILQRV